MYLMSAIDRRWISVLSDQIKNQIKKIEQNMKVIISDSSNNSCVRKTQLPGGIISAIQSKNRPFFDEESIKKDGIGRQNTFKLSNGKKNILVIPVY